MISESGGSSTPALALASRPERLPQPGLGSARAAQLDSAAEVRGSGASVSAGPCQDAAASAALLNNLGNHYLVCGAPGEGRALLRAPAEDQSRARQCQPATGAHRPGSKQGTKALQYLSQVKDSSPAVLLLRAEASHYAGEARLRLSHIRCPRKGVKRRPARALRLGNDLRAASASTIGPSLPSMPCWQRVRMISTFSSIWAARPRGRSITIGPTARLEVAVKLQPADADALLELGLVYAALQDYSRSVYVLAQARQRAPKRPDILLALARAAEDAGYYGDSAMAYDEYLQLRPADDTARRDRGRVCGYTGTRLAEGLKGTGLVRSKASRRPDRILRSGPVHLDGRTADGSRAAVYRAAP